MTWLISSSLRLRLVVVVLSAVLIVFGVRTLEKAPLDVFPEFAPPQVEIQTEAPGLSTEEVESLVSMPLEQALRYETDLTVILQTTEDRAEGVRAFLDKRKPEFKGR